MIIPVNTESVKRLMWLHDVYGKKDIQTIRGGTQVGLSHCPYDEVKAVIDSISSAIGVPLTEAWSIRMNKGGYHEMHNHPDGKLSGVYYMKTGDGADLIVGGCRIKPSEGMLVTFPSCMEHGTTVYEGDEPRLTVAFDIQ